MALTPPIKDEDAAGEVAELFEHVKSRRGGRIYTEFRMMGHAPGLAKSALDLQDRHLHADDDVLDAKTREAIALATSIANGCADCVKSHAMRAKKLGWTDGDVAEILGLVAECSMLNAYHRHRHLDESLGLNEKSGMPMHLTAAPTIGRKTAELIAVVVSGLNACTFCVKYHTQAAKAQGTTDEQIQEAVRVGAAMTAFNTFFRIQ